MQHRKKVYGLLAIWLFMAVSVVIVWLLHEHKKVATVYILPVDGELMNYSWEEFQQLMDSLQPFGILLEPDTLGQKPDFGKLAGLEISDSIKKRYSEAFRPITPDSLYQKAFAISIRKSVDKLDEAAYQKLVAWEEKTPQKRRIALLSEDTIRDRILDSIHLGRVELLGPHFERIPKRYAGLLMGKINKLIKEYPNRRWVILVDIEKYNWLKSRLIQDQRIVVVNEKDM